VSAARKITQELSIELHNLYASPNIIRGRWAANVEGMGAIRNAHKIFVGKPAAK
jgi:hypothetical protein